MLIDEAAAALIAAGRRLGARGLISAGEGNLSIRLDGGRLLITPTGRRKDELEPDDLVLIRLGHPAAAEAPTRSPSGLGPSSDLRIHLAVHAARPDIGAVVHAHLPASMALTLAGEIPDPAALPETALLLPRLPLPALRGDGQPGARRSRRGGPRRTAMAHPPNAVLLERHGAVAVGPDAATAVDRLELIEVLCRTWRDALLLRAARAQVDSAGYRGAAQDPVHRPHPGGKMNTRKILAELVGTFLFLTIGYVSVANFGASAEPCPRSSSCRSRSASACSPRSSRSATSPAATSTRPSRSR